MIFQSKSIKVQETIKNLKAIIATPAKLSLYFPENFTIEKISKNEIALKIWGINFFMQLNTNNPSDTKVCYQTTSPVVNFAMKCSLQTITDQLTSIEIRLQTEKINPLIKGVMQKNFTSLIETMSLNFEKYKKI